MDFIDIDNIRNKTWKTNYKLGKLGFPYKTKYDILLFFKLYDPDKEELR